MEGITLAVAIISLATAILQFLTAVLVYKTFKKQHGNDQQG